jgi:hypothetical protein
VGADIKKVTKRMASISARQAEKKRVRAVYGVATPEEVFKQREHLGFTSQDQAERVAKAADTRLRKKAERSVGDTLEAFHPTRRRSAHFVLTRERFKNYERDRQRKLRGEWIDGLDWFAMMDVANALKDHRILQLRASPIVTGYGVGK